MNFAINWTNAVKFLNLNKNAKVYDKKINLPNYV